MRQSAKKDVSADIAAIFNNAQEYPVFTSIDDQATLVYNNTVDFYKWYIQPKNLPSDGSGVIFGDNFRKPRMILVYRFMLLRQSILLKHIGQMLLYLLSIAGNRRD